MIVGIGNDIIEVERVAKSGKKRSFLKKCYTLREIALFERKPQSLAGNFAVKESVAKAFGTGFFDFSPCDIEVLRNKDGQPYVVLHHNAKKRAEQLEVKKILVSISNLKELAMATVVLEK